MLGIKQIVRNIFIILPFDPVSIKSKGRQMNKSFLPGNFIDYRRCIIALGQNFLLCSNLKLAMLNQMHSKLFLTATLGSCPLKPLPQSDLNIKIQLVYQVLFAFKIKISGGETLPLWPL
jgi:hypothetical protein